MSDKLNDRFRFRLWDDELKTYFHSNDDGSLQFDIEKVLDGLSVHEAEVLEQCTGLKDKNGRLIYEGDIVFHRDKNIEIGKVEWDKGGFWVVCEKWIIPWNFFTPSRWEVVGNVHENNELLEDK